MNNEQDLRRLNSVFRLLPMTSVCIVIGSLSLSGFPFMSGFYSKDAILEVLFYKYKSSNFFIFLLAEIGVVLTGIYSLKIIYYLFFKRNFNYISNFK
jgi:NADH-ubiquinone oxidoreductase chain 5